MNPFIVILIHQLFINVLVDICAGVSCPNYGTCQQTDSGFKCTCQKVCNEPYSPICGNDGSTYNNKCQMQIKSCITKKLITMKHVGKCGKCLTYVFIVCLFMSLLVAYFDYSYWYIFRLSPSKIV